MADERRRAHRRAAAHELHTARALKTERVLRGGRRVSAPDVKTIALVCGLVLQAECKARKRAPKVILDGLDQARRYAPAAVPCVVLRPMGSSALVVLGLEAFAVIAGIEPEAMPKKHRPTRRDPRQLELGGVT